MWSRFFVKRDGFFCGMGKRGVEIFLIMMMLMFGICSKFAPYNSKY